MTRLEALALYREVKTPADIRAMLAGDLFFLMLVGMGRADMNCDFLYDRCREVQASPTAIWICGRVNTTNRRSSLSARRFRTS